MNIFDIFSPAPYFAPAALVTEGSRNISGKQILTLKFAKLKYKNLTLSLSPRPRRWSRPPRSESAHSLHSGPDTTFIQTLHAGYFIYFVLKFPSTIYYDNHNKTNLGSVCPTIFGKWAEREPWEKKMKIQCFRQTCARQTDTHCDTLSSWRSQKYHVLYVKVSHYLHLDGDRDTLVSAWPGQSPRVTGRGATLQTRLTSGAGQQATNSGQVKRLWGLGIDRG